MSSPVDERSGSPMDFYDYRLPDSAIAQDPVEPRNSARLLVATDKGIPELHRTVADLPSLLREGDLLVINSTRVLPARLILTKQSGGSVEVFLLEPERTKDGDVDSGLVWQAMVRRGRRTPPGTPLYAGGRQVAVVGESIGDDGRRLVELSDHEVPQMFGAVPLPPYIHRALADPERYQTVYADVPGAVAAPTAGLHLTLESLNLLRAQGVDIATVDLAVGIGTFRPITVDRPENHVMHEERYRVPLETWDACRRAERVIAVGTTTVRSLETVAATGKLEGRSSLFIHGRYDFEVVDLLMTNFHLPRSSLLLLVDAFYGPRWRALYDEALDSGYRFLSFGDAMLLGRDAGR